MQADTLDICTNPVLDEIVVREFSRLQDAVREYETIARDDIFNAVRSEFREQGRDLGNAVVARAVDTEVLSRLRMTCQLHAFIRGDGEVEIGDLHQMAQGAHIARASIYQMSHKGFSEELHRSREHALHEYDRNLELDRGNVLV